MGFTEEAVSELGHQEGAEEAFWGQTEKAKVQR